MFRVYSCLVFACDGELRRCFDWLIDFCAFFFFVAVSSFVSADDSEMICYLCVSAHPLITHSLDDELLFFHLRINSPRRCLFSDYVCLSACSACLSLSLCVAASDLINIARKRPESVAQKP